jgi:RNA polymerase sigma factor (sigma-70 family)
MPAIRVLLVDDHKLFRAGIRSLLQTVSDIEVVAEAGDGREGLRLIEAHRPDVVLMDIMMPGLNGLDAAARVARTCHVTRVIMLSMNAGEDSVLQALRAGAAGYLVKTADPAELELAIRAVARGETFLSSAISQHVIAVCLGRLDKEKRRRGHASHDAQDLTQDFFAHILEKRGLEYVDPKLGRFRTFLLAALKNFLANDWDRAQARKRGGGQTIVSLDEESAESRYQREPSHDATPERHFERQWAMTLLDQVLDALGGEYHSDGKGDLFEEIKAVITGESGT